MLVRILIAFDWIFFGALGFELGFVYDFNFIIA